MKVYHGSTQAVEYPLVGVGRENLDFGKGFSINLIDFGGHRGDDVAGCRADYRAGDTDFRCQ